MMFNDTCTIYNKYTDSSGVEKWQRTVLEGVYWDGVHGANFKKTGLENSDTVMLIIPKSVRSVNAYRQPKQWQTLQTKSGYFTIASGDTIIRGAIAYNVVRSSKELEQFDDCHKVTKVDFKGFGSDMDHWEVGGR